MSRKRHKGRLIGDGLGEYGRRLFCEQMDEVNAKIKQMEQEKQNSTEREGYIMTEQEKKITEETENKNLMDGCEDPEIMPGDGVVYENGIYWITRKKSRKAKTSDNK